MRLAMSRPSESVPSQCSDEGGCRRAPRSWTSGSYGASSGARRAHAAKRAMSAMATTFSGLPRMGAARAARRRPRTETDAALTTLRPRVEPEIRDVDEQVRDRVDDRSEQRDAEHRRKIERDRSRGRVAPETGPAEDCLGQHRAREKAAKGETEDRDRRDERVAQPVSHDDEPLLEPLGP